MARPTFIVAAMLALVPASAARSQVTVDVAKITCDQFLLYKVTDPQNIALWLSGYYNAKRNNTIIDTQQLVANVEKVKDYCRMKPTVTVMQAVETIFDIKK
jgi:hypothetical protein